MHSSVVCRTNMWTCRETHRLGLVRRRASPAIGAAAEGARKAVKRHRHLPGGLSVLLLLGSATCGLRAAPPIAPPAVAAEAEAVEELVELVVGNPNTPQARAFGARRLLELKTPEAEAALVRILSEGQPEAVMAVAGAVAQGRDTAPPALVPPLVGLLSSESLALRDAAEQALVHYRDGEVAARVGAMAQDRSASPSVRMSAVRVLGRLAGEASAVDALVAMADDPDARIRGEIWKVLGLLSGGRAGQDVESARRWWGESREGPASDRWRALLSAREAAMSRAAGESRALAERLRRALREQYAATPEAARVSRLADYLADPLAEVRATGASLVASMVADRMPIPASLVETMGRLVGDESVEVRRAALTAIGGLREPSLAPVLIARWPSETEPDLRRDLIVALGRLGNAEAIPFLIERVAEENDPSVAALAATGLARLAGANNASAPAPSGVAEALTSLLERLDVAEVNARERVVEAMAVLGDARFVPTFLAMLDDELPAVREAAVQGLTKVGDPGHILPLLARLQDDDAAVRLAAVEAVARLGNEPAHVDALLRHVDAPQEAEAGVRAAAWDGCLKIVRGWPIAEQIAWSGRLDPDLDRISAQRLVAVLYPIVKQTNPAEVTAELTESNARLGTALGSLGRHEEAAAAWQQVYAFYSAQKDARAVAAGVQLARSLLAIEQPDRAVELLSQLAVAWPDADRTDAAGAVIDYLNGKLGSEQFDAVVEWSDRVLDTSPPLFDTKARVRIAEFRAAALECRAAEDARHVEMWLAQMRGPEAEAAEAARQIHELGERAVPALVDGLRALLASDPPPTAAEDERRILGLLQDLRSDWPGYAPNATREQKLAALSKVSPPGSQPTGPR